jgi:hypothetical protein
MIENPELVRALMYAQPDEDEELDEDDEDDTRVNPFAKKIPSETGVELEFAGKFATLTVDGKKIVMPTAPYVRQLETTVTAQAKQILRMNSEIKKLRATVNKLIGDVNDVNRELDRKVSLRDMP